MLRRIQFALGTILVALAPLGGIQDARISGLVGRVVDASSGAPIPGARVRVSGQTGEGPVQTATDELGRFLFTGAAAGSIRVEAAADGYLPQLGPVLMEVTVGSITAIGRPIRLFRLASISGILTDDTSSPLPGVMLRVMRTDTFIEGGAQLFTRTDDLGRYKLSGVPPGDYVVAALATSESRIIRSGTPASVNSTLLMHSDKVGLEVRQDFSSQTQTIRPRRDSRGISLIPSCFYPSAPEPSAATALTVGPGEDRVGIDLVCPRVQTTTITGIVNGPAGRVAGATVRLLPGTASHWLAELGRDVARTTTNSEGRFALAGVPSGSYLALVEDARRGMEALTTIAVGSEPVADIVVTLSLRHTVTGQIKGVDRSVRVLLEPVRARRSDLAARRNATETDGQGRYRIDGVPAGLYSVRVVGPSTHGIQQILVDGDDHTSKPLDISGSVTVDITLAPYVGTVSIRPNRLAGAEDLDWSALVIPATPESWEFGWFDTERVRRAEVSTSGMAVVRNLMPGDYLMVAVPTRAVLGHWRAASRLMGLAPHARLIHVSAEGEIVVPSVNLK